MIHASFPTPGDLISHGSNNYRIGRRLGDGAFGVCFECWDDWGNELVAKVFKPTNSYAEVSAAWLREQQILVALRHPNIVHVYDAFEYNYTFYLIMERCMLTLEVFFEPGTQLQGKLWLPGISRCLLQAVEFMHNLGYVHKDLHPGNVFVAARRDELDITQEPSKTYKIGDLGITRLEHQIGPGTMLAQWMLPPEYLDPSFGALGRQVDIYHLGLLFLGLSTGVMHSFSEQDIRGGVPRQLAEQLEPPLNIAISKALRRHTVYRTATAKEFWDDMKTWVFAQRHGQVKP